MFQLYHSRSITYDIQRRTYIHTYTMSRRLSRTVISKQSMHARRVHKGHNPQPKLSFVILGLHQWHQRDDLRTRLRQHMHASHMGAGRPSQPTLHTSVDTQVKWNRHYSRTQFSLLRDFKGCLGKRLARRVL